MNRMQKVAWFQLSLLVVMAVLSIIFMFHFRTKYEYGYLYAWELGAAHAYPMIILIVLGPLIFFRKKKGRVDYDERDLIIDRQSAVASFAAYFGFTLVVFLAMWLTLGIEKLIPVHRLGNIIFGGFVFAVIAGAVTTLVCYGRGVKDGE